MFGHADASECISIIHKGVKIALNIASHQAAGLLVPVRPSVHPRKPRPWRDIAILACLPPPEPSVPACSRSALTACHPCLPPNPCPSVRPCKPRAWRDIFTIQLLGRLISVHTPVRPQKVSSISMKFGIQVVLDDRCTSV